MTPIPLTFIMFLPVIIFAGIAALFSWSELVTERVASLRAKRISPISLLF